MSLRFTKYLSAFVAIMLMLFSVVAGGIFFFVPVIYSFIVIPLLELFMEHSSQNMTKAEEEVAKKDISFDILLWLIVPVQYILVGIFLYKLKTEPLSWWEIIGIISALGMSCGIFGINVAHELGHRNTWYEQLMSKALLLTSLYMHFFIEHNRGHHKNVSTDEDPASARYGETLYAFWLRSIINSWLHAWKLENNRLEKTGKKMVFTTKRDVAISAHSSRFFVAYRAVFRLVANAMFYSSRHHRFFVAGNSKLCRTLRSAKKKS